MTSPNTSAITGNDADLAVSPAELEAADHPLFDAEWYLRTYLDVASSPMTPYEHYRQYGASEGRLPNPYLDPSWYLKAYPELQDAGIDPLDHYFDSGWREGRNPGPKFSTNDYLERHPELQAVGLNPLSHAMSQAPHEAWIDLQEGLESLPPAIVGEATHFEDETAGVAAAIDSAWVVPDVGVFISGWLVDSGQQLDSVVIRTGDCRSDDVRPQLLRRWRPDVAETYRKWFEGPPSEAPGMYGLVPCQGISAESHLSDLVIEFTFADGSSRYLRSRNSKEPSSSAIRTIRSMLTVAAPREIEALDEHIGPAVAAIWAGRSADDGGFDVKTYGQAPSSPEVSVIVPIYGRYDFIEYQTALFSEDPEMGLVELIYVVDDPSLNVEAKALCRRVVDIFGLPLKLVLRERNGGFARAINTGATVATGATLLLLNSDVMPMAPGWLGRLRSRLETASGAGVVAPVLLFPDGSVQHAGIVFDESRDYPGVWLNKHPGKGLPLRGEVAKRLQPLPAVTAACMMLRADVFEAAGGLDEDYIVGDFEDTDLCLKLQRQGLNSYLAPEARLYHLERQSQHLDADFAWRHSLTVYNAWRHSRRWEAEIRDWKMKGAGA